MPKPRILIVDDSPTARLVLRAGLDTSGTLDVVGEARTGAEALQLVRKLRPDLVTMDVYLGDDDGVKVTREIMASCPTPIVIVTGVDPRSPQLVFRAVEAGALQVEGKLPARSHPGYAAQCRRLVRILEALARVPVVSRRPGASRPTPAVDPAPRVMASVPKLRAVVMGASTGGPPVLHTILSALPAPFPLPVAIVQHVAEGFGAGLAAWLHHVTGHRTLICDRPMPFEPGTVYLANDVCHMRLQSCTSVAPFFGPARGYQRPSVDELFESAAACFGTKVAGVLLTGMGRDGVDGMTALKGSGAITISQQPDTCIVDSMPAGAMDAKATTYVMTPEVIAQFLQQVAGPAVAR